MFLDPKKMIASLVLSGLILGVGAMSLATQNPTLSITKFLSPLASTENVNSLANNAQIISTDNTNQNTKIDEQISPENAIIEVEAMIASVDANYPSYNNNDWSLDTISDHALEINQ